MRDEVVSSFPPSRVEYIDFEKNAVHEAWNIFKFIVISHISSLSKTKLQRYIFVDAELPFICPTII